MKPGEKARLVKCREDLVRSLEINNVLPALMRPNMFTREDENKIICDPRRRERILIFLNILEKKSSETFQAFCDVLEERYPHLFLLLSDWDDDGYDHGAAYASDAKLHDEWAIIHHNRAYLIQQIDAAKITSPLRAQNILNDEQVQQIVSDPQIERRTETFLDILEMRPPGSYSAFLEAVGEIYPHVYLALTNDEGLDDL